MACVEDLARAKRTEDPLIFEGTVRLSEVIAYLAEDGFLPRRAAARFCGVSWRTLESQTDLPAYRVGRKIVYRKSELVAWVCAHQIQSSDPVPARNDLQSLMNSAVSKARANAATRRSGGPL